MEIPANTVEAERGSAMAREFPGGGDGTATIPVEPDDGAAAEIRKI
jgi:hypothetical protein